MTSPSVNQAILRVVEEMHERLDQELTIDDMARIAMFSKFHFTRIFRLTTGTSPRRFLSALRIQEAKNLLVSTDMSVVDVSSRVGYSSVGTFSTRFKTCVGVSPSMYRESGGDVSALGSAPVRAADDGPAPLTIRGRVVLPGDRALGQVFIGLFPSAILQGRPVRHTVMDGPGPFQLHDVPPGTWHVLAYSVPYGTPLPAGRGGYAPGALSVGRYGPVTVQPGVAVLPADIVLRQADPLDPPILVALSGRDLHTPVAA